MTSLILTAACAVGACANSPLFNHRQAQLAPVTVAPAEGETTPALCPLEFPKSGFCASLRWTQGPSEEGSAFSLKFWRKDQGNVESGPFLAPAPQLKVQLWMPSMGHGSSPVKVESPEPGVYNATDVNFIMPGDWDVRLQLKDGRDLLEQVTFSVKI